MASFTRSGSFISGLIRLPGSSSKSCSSLNKIPQQGVPETTVCSSGGTEAVWFEFVHITKKEDPAVTSVFIPLSLCLVQSTKQIELQLRLSDNREKTRQRTATHKTTCVQQDENEDENHTRLLSSRQNEESHAHHHRKVVVQTTLARMKSLRRVQHDFFNTNNNE